MPFPKAIHYVTIAIIALHHLLIITPSSVVAQTASPPTELFIDIFAPPPTPQPVPPTPLPTTASPPIITTVAPPTTAIPPTPMPTTAVPPTTAAPLSCVEANASSIYEPFSFSPCCDAFLRALSPDAQQCATTFGVCAQSQGFFDQSTNSLTKGPASKCSTFFNSCVKNYHKCLEQIQSTVSTQIPPSCTWPAVMDTAITMGSRAATFTNSRKNTDCLATCRSYETQTGCGPSGTFQSQVCAPPATAAPSPATIEEKTPPVKAAAATPIVVPGVSAVIFGAGSSCCEMPNPTSGKCACANNDLESTAHVFHSAFSFAQNDQCFSSTFSLTMCVDPSKVPAGWLATQHRLKALQATADPSSGNASALNISAIAAVVEQDISVASLYTQHANGTCAEPNVFSKSCKCPSATHYPRTIPVPIEGANPLQSVRGLLAVCVSNATAVFVRGTQTGGCHNSASPNATCVCLEGAKTLNIPIAYYNGTRVDEGVLSLCAADPRVKVTTETLLGQAGTTGTTAVTGAVGGPGASMLQGAGLVTSMECSSEEAKDLGGAGSLIPFVLVDEEWGGVAALALIFVAFLVLHLLVLSCAYCYHSRRIAREEEEKATAAAQVENGGVTSTNSAAKTPATEAKSVSDRKSATPPPPGATTPETAAANDINVSETDKETPPSNSLVYEVDSNPAMTCAMVTAKFPQYTFRAFNYVFMGVTYEGIRLVLHPAYDMINILVGVVSLSIILVYCVFCIRFGAKLGFDSHYRDFVFRKFVRCRSKFGCIFWLLFPKGYWEPKGPYIVKYFELYDPYGDGFLQWLTAMAVIRSIALTILAHNSSEDPDRCRIIYLIICGIFAFTALVFIALRPHRIPFDNLFVFIASLGNAMLAFSLAHPEYSYFDTAFIYQALLWSTLASLLIWCSFPWIEDCFISYEEKEDHKEDENDSVEGKYLPPQDGDQQEQQAQQEGQGQGAEEPPLPGATHEVAVEDC